MKKSNVLFNVVFFLLIAGCIALFGWGIYVDKAWPAILAGFSLFIIFFSILFAVFLKDFNERCALANLTKKLSATIERDEPDRILEVFGELENEPRENFYKQNGNNLVLMKKTFGEILPQILTSIIKRGEMSNVFAFSEMIQIMLEIVYYQRKPSKRFSELVRVLSTDIVTEGESSSMFSRLSRLVEKTIAEVGEPPKRFSELAMLTSK